MKLFLAGLLLPALSSAQKIKVNQYDKFIQQRRVESHPLVLLDGKTTKTALAFSATGANYTVQLSGTGTGTNIIGEDDKIIFLLDNDSTITAKSTGTQTYDVSKIPSTYRHDYSIAPADLEVLGRRSVQAIRKYYQGRYYDDIFLPKAAGAKMQALSNLFIKELRSGNLLGTVVTVPASEASKHVGDSIAVVGKIAGGRYLPDAADSPTLLNMGAAFPNQQLTIVIPGLLRSAFAAQPETLFDGKEVMVTGRVQLYRGKPQIVLSSKEQVVLTATPPALPKKDAVVAAPKASSGTTAAVENPQAPKTTVTEKSPSEPGAKTPAPALPSAKPGSIAPAFPGGVEAFTYFLQRNLKGADQLPAGITKTVVVNFKVAATGAVSDVTVQQGAGDPYDAEVVRVLRRMPYWKPAIEGGRKVAGIVTQTVSFVGGSQPAVTINK